MQDESWCLRVGEVTVGEVTVGEVTVGEVTVGEVTVGEVTVGEVTVGEVTVGEVTVGEVTVGEVTVGCSERRQCPKGTDGRSQFGPDGSRTLQPSPTPAALVPSGPVEGLVTEGQTSEALDDPGPNLGRLFVLPRADHVPPLTPESNGCVRVSSLVGRQLRRPPGPVGRGGRPVFWATVPEASIDEDCDLGASEGDIDRSARPVWDRVVDAVAVSGSVQQAAYGELAIVVPALQSAHAARDGFTRRARVRRDVERESHASIVPLKAWRLHPRAMLAIQTGRHAMELVQLEQTF
ncbi:hypothetical protein CELL_00085 [Cellulomonas sp. T2.31MG-18]